MLTGRQKIEAAFSREGSREFAATICWEYVFTRKELEPPVIGGWSRFGQLEPVSSVRLPTTQEELDAAVVLPAPADTERIVADGRADLARALLQAHGTQLYPITYVDAPLWYLYELWGFEGMMTLIGERPDLVERAWPVVVYPVSWKQPEALSRQPILDAYQGR